MPSIGELFVALGFDVDDKKLKEFKADVKDGLETLLKMSAAAAGAVAAIDLFVRGSVNSAQAMANFNTVTGDNIDTLERWQNVITLTNPLMKIEDVTAGVKALDKAVSDALNGKGNSGAFSMLGINLRDDKGNVKTSDQLLREMRQNFLSNVANLPGGRPAVVDYMSQVGVPEGFANALDPSRTSQSQFDKLFNRPIVDAGEREKLTDLGQAIADVDNKVTLLRAKFSSDMAPTLTKWAHESGDALTDLEPKIVEVAKNFDAVNDSIKKMWDSMDASDHTHALEAASAVLLAWKPVAILFLGIGSVMDQMGANMRGKTTPIGGVNDDILQALGHTPRPTAYFGNVGKEGDAQHTFIHDILGDKSIWRAWMDNGSQILDKMDPQKRNFFGTQGGAPVAVTVNNHITSTAEPVDLMEEIARETGLSYQSALSQTNTGAQR